MGAAESTAKVDFECMDFYDILGISEDATSEEITVSSTGSVNLRLFPISLFVVSSVRIANEPLNIIQIRIRTILKEQRSDSRKCMMRTK
jgi:hypothetical protein